MDQNGINSLIHVLDLVILSSMLDFVLFICLFLFLFFFFSVLCFSPCFCLSFHLFVCQKNIVFGAS